jgi:hypothetical protein
MIENTPQAAGGSRIRNPGTDTASTKTVGHSRQNRPEQTRAPRPGPDNVDIPPVSAKGNPGPPQKVA